MEFTKPLHYILLSQVVVTNRLVLVMFLFFHEKEMKQFCDHHSLSTLTKIYVSCTHKMSVARRLTVILWLAYRPQSLKTKTVGSKCPTDKRRVRDHGFLYYQLLTLKLY